MASELDDMASRGTTSRSKKSSIPPVKGGKARFEAPNLQNLDLTRNEPSHKAGRYERVKSCTQFSVITWVFAHVIPDEDNTNRVGSAFKEVFTSE